MRRTLVVLAIALTLSVSGAIGLAKNSDGPSTAAPATPPPPAARIASLDTGELDRSIAALRARTAEVPGDHVTWATLGVAYVEQARAEGKDALYNRADRAIARSFDAEPVGNALAHAAAGATAAARHDFTTALAQADRALAINPYDLTALSVRVDALTELGRYDDQLAALETADRRQPGIATSSRYSYAFELRGQLDRARAILRRSLPAASPQERAFLLTLMADIDRRQGDLDEAARRLNEAGRLAPDHTPVLVGRARLAVARGDLDAALPAWRAVVAKLPHPEIVVELAELHLLAGRDQVAARQLALVSEGFAASGQTGMNEDLEKALVEADHGSPVAALEAAEAEWDRRQSIHTAHALGWALHVNGRDREALRYARSSTRLGTAEAMLWLHRGQIEAALGLDRAATRSLRRGLATDAGVSPWQAERARGVLRSLT